MSAGAAEVTAILSKLAGDVAPARSEWAGAAQVRFNALWDQLELDVIDLQSVLGGMAKLTKNAATRTRRPIGESQSPLTNFVSTAMSSRP